MAEGVDEKALAPVSSVDMAKGEMTSIDRDAMKLAEMGYTQDMQRNFSVWSVLGVGFSLTNSWFGISAALVTGINSGGPILIIYGIILIALVSTCVGISLSELASALPNAGGQYFWANELAPKRYANFASYLTGWFAWWGSIFTSASVALAMGSAMVGCYQLSHPDFVIKSWHVFVAYQMANIFCFFFNCYGKTLPTVAKVTLWTSLISFAVILITVPAVAPTHQHAKFVFATFINNTGWEQGGIAFIVGLVNTNWSFACLDCATHLAEEVHRPERMIPIAIMGTVAIGFVTSWFWSMAMFFSIVGDFQDIVGSATLVPILELFYKALNNKGGAIFLEALIIATGLGCLVASHTWQSRLCWSFARDRGLPGHQWLSKVHPTLDVPVIAHFASCVIVAIVGCLYLASLTAFNSMITACIVLLYISYSIPVICLLLKGRSNLKPGPFFLGPVGLVANCVLLAWTLFTLVMYSFPYAKPVKAGNMNYVSAVYAVVTSIMAVDWLVRGRKSFRGVGERKSDVVHAVEGVRSGSVGAQGGVVYA
ncbi:choline transport protein-like protein [Trematosphaeria pertusa]|uniref:Choline transport protein-like protein n=1 Tax=Trematosphaeria pertusa TaxID=390896 RepID=A0A6A6J4D0_9PLEO|nr:choline transport protein-like protein [Trematosphaeria pertusa]KAF2257408.1 choline transport protein-like protein [Trematosphaeria pertusa]